MNTAEPTTFIAGPIDVKDMNERVVARVAGYLNQATGEYLVIADSKDATVLDGLAVRNAAYGLRVPMNLHNAGIEPRSNAYRIEADEQPASLYPDTMPLRRVFRLNIGI